MAACLTGPAVLYQKRLVAQGRQLGVPEGEPAGVVRRQPERDLPPPDVDVGVVIMRFGVLGHALHEGDSIEERAERVGADELFPFESPLGVFLEERGERVFGQRRSVVGHGQAGLREGARPVIAFHRDLLRVNQEKDVHAGAHLSHLEERRNSGDPEADNFVGCAR
jgi:hypothetical protein